MAMFPCYASEFNPHDLEKSYTEIQNGQVIWISEDLYVVLGISMSRPTLLRGSDYNLDGKVDIDVHNSAGKLVGSYDFISTFYIVEGTSIRHVDSTLTHNMGPTPYSHSYAMSYSLDTCNTGITFNLHFDGNEHNYGSILTCNVFGEYSGYWLEM